jgi:hypothetical protein
MAAVIPEAAEAVAEGGTAVRGASTAGRARSGARAARARYAAVPDPVKQRGRNAARSASRARIPGGRNYQPVILAEFVVAVLVIALAPIAKQSQQQAGTTFKTPYNPNHLKQLVAAGVVYFVLALFSGGRHGRVAAWFGGLVLLGIGFMETVSGGLAAEFKIFGPGAPPPNLQDGSPAAPALGDTGGAVFVPVPDATGNFPVINPSTTQSGGPLPGVTQGPPPGVAAPANGTVSQVTPPPGGNGVLTT